MDVEPKRVALYARVSTKQHGQDPETQLQPLRAFVASHNPRYVIAGEYVDVGISGSKERRPQLDRMINDAKRKRIDAVIVWRFDRFARSVSHLLRALEDFRKWGIDFVSITEAIDTSTAVGRLVFTILGAVAEMERELIQERVRAGVDRAKREGKKLGRPRVLVDEERVYERIEAGVSVRQLARETGVARGTIESIAQRWRSKKSLESPARSPAPVDT